MADTYVESPLELAVAPELDEYDLVEQEADQIEGLRDVGGLVSGVSHDGSWFWMRRDRPDLCEPGWCMASGSGSLLRQVEASRVSTWDGMNGA